MKREEPPIGGAKTSIRVAVVEDDARVRMALEKMLRADAGCECVGAFRTGEEAVERLPALEPGVVVMDINLPGISGIECVKQLSPRMEGSHFLMLTIYHDAKTIFDALAAGAHGYLLKPVDPSELGAAVRDVIGGGAPMTSGITRKVIDFFRQPAPASTASDDTALAPREREVLEHLVQGLAYKEIADRMSVSYSTVNTLLQRIYRKLHVRSRGEAVARYLKRAD